MSFAAETSKLVEQLIQAEYKNARNNFGWKYHSLHEGYAVLLEEVEEVGSELDDLGGRWLKTFWSSIKNDSYYEPKECIEELEICVQNAIKELAQVGAVLMKIQNIIFDEVEE